MVPVHFQSNLLEAKSRLLPPPYSVDVCRRDAIEPSDSHQDFIPDLLDRRFLAAKRHQEAQKMGSLIHDTSLNLRQLVREHEENVFAKACLTSSRIQ